MTISLHADTIPQDSHNITITAWHETFDNLNTPVYVSGLGPMAFTIPAEDAKRFGR